MPAVHIEYRSDFNSSEFGPRQLEAVKQVILSDCPQRFSTKEVKLSRDDFSILFQPAYPPSVLTHDMIVRIQLHHFKQRLKDTDSNAEDLAHAIAHSLVADNYLTVGVSLLVAEIGWGTSRNFNEGPTRWVTVDN